MRILITNDDGWGCKGILCLTRLMRRLGEVYVVAPDGPRSAQSSAITIDKPVIVKQIEENIYTCTGTPADCVKVALNTIFQDDKPDLIVAGINHGSNASVNILYSGTLGAVFVGAENSIPAIGFSIIDHSLDADFSFFEPYILPLTQLILQQKQQYGICYNINAPIGEIKGYKITRQCQGHWHKEFKRHLDDNGNPYYLLTGDFLNHEPEAQDTDEYALQHGYIAVTPTTIDMTAHNISLPDITIP